MEGAAAADNECICSLSRLHPHGQVALQLTVQALLNRGENGRVSNGSGKELNE